MLRDTGGSRYIRSGSRYIYDIRFDLDSSLDPTFRPPRIGEGLTPLQKQSAQENQFSGKYSIFKLVWQTHPAIPGTLENVQMNAEQYRKLRKQSKSLSTGEVFYEDFQGTIVHDYSALVASDDVVLHLQAHQAFNQSADYETYPVKIQMDSYPLANVKLSADQFKELRNQGFADFRGAILTDLDLQGCDLTECDFTDAYLRGSNLTGCAGLDSVIFISANVRNCIFNIGVDVAIPPSLKHVCNKKGAVMFDASAQEQEIATVSFYENPENSLFGVKLNAKQFIHLIQKGRRDFVGVILTNLKLNHESIDLNGLRKITVEVTDSKGVRANIEFPGLVDLELQHACLDDCDFTGIVFQNCNMSCVSTIDTVFDRCYFIGVDLERADCEMASFVNANLFEASVNKTNLRCTRFTGVTLGESRYGFFEGANITGTSFEAGRLRGVPVTQRYTDHATGKQCSAIRIDWKP